jgi:hypothetical protein
MTEQKRAGESIKSVQDVKMLGHFSKSDIRYWQAAIFRQTYTRSGRTFVTKDWAMKVAHEGRRETFPLGTPNKAAAAARARDIYLSLVAVGWEPTLARFKKPKTAAPAANNDDNAQLANSSTPLLRRQRTEVLSRATQRNSGKSYPRFLAFPMEIGNMIIKRAGYKNG